MSRNTFSLRLSKLTIMNWDQLHSLHLDRISKTDATEIPEGDTANQLSQANLSQVAHLLVLAHSLCCILRRMCYFHAILDRISLTKASVPIPESYSTPHRMKSSLQYHTINSKAGSNS